MTLNQARKLHDGERVEWIETDLLGLSVLSACAGTYHSGRRGASAYFVWDDGEKTFVTDEDSVKHITKIAA